MITGGKWREQTEGARRIKLQQRYNKEKWDGAGRDAIATGAIPAASHGKTGCNNPVRFPGSDLVQDQEKIHCSQLESFQHPRPPNLVFGRTEGGEL